MKNLERCPVVEVIRYCGGSPTCTRPQNTLQESPRHRIFLANPSDQQSADYLDVNTEVHWAVANEIFQSPGCPTTNDVGNKIFLWRWLLFFFFLAFFFPLSLFAVCSQWHLVDAVHRLPGTVPHLGHPSEVAFAECVRLEKFKHHPSSVWELQESVPGV